MNRHVSKILFRLMVIMHLVGGASFLMAANPALGQTIGERPRIAGLATLRSGVSTKAEVLAAMGIAPRGYGFTRYTADQPLRNLWSYEFMQIQGAQIGLQIVLIFFREDVYEGYFWFSAEEIAQ